MKKKIKRKENRIARLTVLIDPDKKTAFEGLCKELDTNPSQIVRFMIREFLTEHGVEWKTGTK